MFAAASSLMIIWTVFVSRTKGLSDEILTVMTRDTFLIGELEAEESITGLITYPGEQDLPNECHLELQLQDITSMNDRPEIVASIMLTNLSSFPISFDLLYNSSTLVHGHQYSMIARIIESNGNLLFVNDENSLSPTMETTMDAIHLTMMKGEPFLQVQNSNLDDCNYIL